MYALSSAHNLQVLITEGPSHTSGTMLNKCRHILLPCRFWSNFMTPDQSQNPKNLYNQFTLLHMFALSSAHNLQVLLTEGASHIIGSMLNNFRHISLPSRFWSNFMTPDLTQNPKNLFNQLKLLHMNAPSSD